MPWHDPPLRAPGIATLADGEHDGVRWWLQQLDGLPGLQLTVSGVVGEHSVVAFAEFGTADLTLVEGWLARLFDKKRAAWARKAELAVIRREGTPKPVPGRPMPTRQPMWLVECDA